MSIRDSRVISKFINEEFNFLNGEMEQHVEITIESNAEDSKQSQDSGTLINVNNSLSCNDQPSSLPPEAFDVNGHNDPTGSSVEPIGSGNDEQNNNRQSSCSDSAATKSETSHVDVVQSVEHGDLKEEENVTSSGNTIIASSVIDERMHSVDSGVGLTSLAENTSVEQVDTVSELPGTTGTSVGNKEQDKSPESTPKREKKGGVYDASFRSSQWMFVREEESEYMGSNESLDDRSSENGETSGITTPTDSQKEANFQPYKRSYKKMSFKNVQRKSSLQKYAQEQNSEVTAEKVVTFDKAEGDGLGFSIGDNYPTKVGDVVPGSQAAQKGLEVGDVLLAVNYESVLSKTSEEIVKILRNVSGSITLELCKQSSMTSELNRNCTVLHSGYLYKLANSTFNHWKKKWFVLNSDNCLYYYENEKNTNIIGAIPLSGYLVQKGIDLKRPNAMKLMHHTKTYSLAASDEDDFSKWAKLLTKATESESTMDNWLAVTSHHVSIPALSITNIDCDGYLYKMGGHYKSWKKRYCVLKDGCVYYYCDINSHAAQGVAHFHGYTIIANPPSAKKNAFELSPPDPKMRTFHFYTDTELEKERWLKAMKLSIGRWVQVLHIS